jgi:ABC-type multidrug transport system ATPase subunit
VLLVDEATHDLDPAAAHQVRAITAELAGSGTAVLWTTQRIEELRGFADRVTVLQGGRVRFDGSLAGLLDVVDVERHVLRLGQSVGAELPRLQALLHGRATLEPVPSGDAHGLCLGLASGCSLGAALHVLVSAGVEVLACHEEQPRVERAFLSLTRPERAA